jgi:hypothetical protein
MHGNTRYGTFANWYVTEAVPPGTLMVVSACRCMTDEDSVPREQCPRCLGTGVFSLRMDNVGD